MLSSTEKDLKLYGKYILTTNSNSLHCLYIAHSTNKVGHLLFSQRDETLGGQLDREYIIH